MPPDMSVQTRMAWAVPGCCELLNSLEQPGGILLQRTGR